MVSLLRSAATIATWLPAGAGITSRYGSRVYRSCARSYTHVPVPSEVAAASTTRLPCTLMGPFAGSTGVVDGAGVAVCVIPPAGGSGCQPGSTTDPSAPTASTPAATAAPAPARRRVRIPRACRSAPRARSAGRASSARPPMVSRSRSSSLVVIAAPPTAPRRRVGEPVPAAGPAPSTPGSPPCRGGIP